MSIINDALKKAQIKLETKAKKQDANNITAPESTIPKSLTEEQPASPIQKKRKKKSSNNIVLLLIMFMFGIVITLLLALFYVVNNSRTATKPSIVQTQLASQADIIPTNNKQNINDNAKTNKRLSPTVIKVAEKTTDKIIKKPILKGTLVMGTKTVALIDNEIFEEGEFVSNFKILKIYSKKVELLDPNNNTIILDVRDSK